ncbi:MAG TPA: hypothetical protein DCQ51_21610, partial [Planktothrix sp. UBA8407]|nr:hypothetical protein [Planktothrix sp. UBA8407]
MRLKQNPVPRLDLAPKLNRPLSLFNPLDYLRLLYWIFFFPQALPIYLNFLFVITEEKRDQETLLIYLEKRLKKYRKNITIFLKQIFILYLFEKILMILFLIVFLQFSSVIKIHLSLMFVELFIIFIFYMWLLILIFIQSEAEIYNYILYNYKQSYKVYKIEVSLISFFAIFIIQFFPLLTIATIGNTNIAIFIIGLIIGIIISFFNGYLNHQGKSNFIVNITLFLIKSKKKFNYLVEPFVYLTLLIPILIVLYNYFIENILMLVENDFFVAYLQVLLITIKYACVPLLIFIMGFLTSFLRPDSWIITKILKLKYFQFESYKNRKFSYITLLPIPGLYAQLKVWLEQDWESGVYNAKQIFTYTLQYISVIQVLNEVLAEMHPEQVIYRVSKLAEPPQNWILLDAISSSTNTGKSSLNTPDKASATGFLYLFLSEDGSKIPDVKKIQFAKKAFAKFKNFPSWHEMFTLTLTLEKFLNANNVHNITAINIPPFPQKPRIRLTTWQTLRILRQVVEDIQMIQSSCSRSARAFAISRALGELRNLRNRQYFTFEPEQELISIIALNWSLAILDIASEVGKVSINEKVQNPYIIGDPVIGKQFIGREDIIKQLEELWIVTPQLQSVVIFGHRRMGKTSILRNISTRLDQKVKLAYVNLLTVGNSIQGVGEVFMAIADSLSDTLQIPPPDDHSLINLPYRTFERYLKQIETHLGDTGLIIALDEFEQIEELIKSDRIPKDFMGVLRGMVQMSPKIAFALAGLHTLEEMTEDYFNPFFASIIPIRVSFLERATCRYLLANPGEDFPLDYKPDALDYIYDLTAGQPYLVQLIGFLLVRRYNDQVFELGNNRDPMFTIADVDGIINQPEFY